MAYKFAYVIFLLYLCSVKMFLALRNLVNSLASKHCDTNAFSVSCCVRVCVPYMIPCAWTTVLLFDARALPEPRNAKQQDCSPAFYIECGRVFNL